MLPRLHGCVLSLLAVLPLVLAPPRAHAANERLKVGDPVRLALDTTRGRLTSDALKGRTYAVVFWNTGSKKFAQALPGLRSLVKQRSAQEFVLIGYSMDQSVATAHRAIAQGKMTWPQALHENQTLPFYNVFYTKRTPVPGAFIISDAGQLHWFGPLSHLVDEVQAMLPPAENPSDPRAPRVAAGWVYRELLRTPLDAQRVFERLRAIPDQAWEQDRGVRLSLRRAARRLARLTEDQRFALQQAAAANKTDATRFERLWALRPERRPADTDAEGSSTTELSADRDQPTDQATGQASDQEPSPHDPPRAAAQALAHARAAEAANDLLTAWEGYRAAANDPDAGPHREAAQAQLQRLEDQAGFAQRLLAARRERSANDLYVKALNLMQAGDTDKADTTLREIRRNYHDTATAAVAERILRQLEPQAE